MLNNFWELDASKTYFENAMRLSTIFVRTKPFQQMQKQTTRTFDNKIKSKKTLEMMKEKKQ